jgi:hypothetical protein
MNIIIAYSTTSITKHIGIWRAYQSAVDEADVDAAVKVVDDSW